MQLKNPQKMETLKQKIGFKIKTKMECIKKGKLYFRRANEIEADIKRLRELEQNEM